MAAKVAVAALCFALAACASYSDMLTREPYRTALIAGGNVAAAECFNAEMMKRGAQSTLLRMTDAEGPHVAGQIQAGQGGNDFILWDVTFRHVSDSQTQAIVRAKIDAWGKPELDAPFWPSMEACGGH